jgi:HAD superfamily hydrolase (TIGR01509 family)
MRRYQGVLLDVDGTLVDSNEAHTQAWVELFAEHDLPVDPGRIRGLIGMGGDRIIELIANIGRDTHHAKRLSKQRSEIFRERWLPRVTPLPGARALLLRLRAEQYQYVIATAAKSEELEPLLEIAGIADLCELRTTSSDVDHSKPDPDIIERALAKLPVERSRCVMIGDTQYDIRAANAAAVDAIGFTSGGRSAEALAGTVAVYRGPADLVARWSDSPLRSAALVHQV